jgi:hypothetical protein
MKKFILLLLFPALTLQTGCASLFGITDLTDIDFEEAIAILKTVQGTPVNRVTPGERYRLTIQAYDPAKDKIRNVYLNKKVLITAAAAEQLAKAKVSGTEFNFTVAQPSMAMLEAGSLQLTVKNFDNGSSLQLKYLFTFENHNELVLGQDKTGNGVTANFIAALFDTALIGSDAGKVLLLIDKNSGRHYITSTALSITANGLKGREGSPGPDGRTVAGRRATDGGDGYRGQTGYRGGNITVTGSAQALAGINITVNGGDGGPGGRGGRGGRGATETITFQEAQRKKSEIEWMEFVDNSETDKNKAKVRVKYRDGADGRPGPYGYNGPEGSYVKEVAPINPEDFKSFETGSRLFRTSMLR